MINILFAGIIAIVSSDQTTEKNSETLMDASGNITGIEPMRYSPSLLRSQYYGNCWRCSSPCAGYSCCNDNGFPQCCHTYHRGCGCCA